MRPNQENEDEILLVLPGSQGNGDRESAFKPAKAGSCYRQRAEVKRRIGTPALNAAMVLANVYSNALAFSQEVHGCAVPFHCA